MVAHGGHGFIRQPGVRAVDPGGLLAGVDLHPFDPALAAIGLLDGGIQHFAHHRRDVHAGAVALDEGDNRPLRHVQGKIGVDGDFRAGLRRLDVAAHDGS
jgi:hypothetical protein